MPAHKLQSGGKLLLRPAVMPSPANDLLPDQIFHVRYRLFIVNPPAVCSENEQNFWRLFLIATVIAGGWIKFAQWVTQNAWRLTMFIPSVIAQEDETDCDEFITA
jgi:hypothetical protein